MALWTGSRKWLALGPDPTRVKYKSLMPPTTRSQANQLVFGSLIPPYYFAVPYADLSDFSFVWLKRILPDHPLFRDPFNSENRLTPKDAELCEMAHWDSVRYPHKDQQFFEDGMTKAFIEVLSELRARAG